jgi:hypothetical protein
MKLNLEESALNALNSLKTAPRPVNKLITTLAVLLLLGGFAAMMPATANAQDQGPVFELRIYTATPGNLDALLNRFRNHTTALFEKHGMTNLGYWVPTDGDEAENTIVYVLKHDSREAANASWRAFATDPEWQAVNEASNADGNILQGLERRYMTATDFSAIQ